MGNPMASPSTMVPDAPGADVAAWYRQYHQRLLEYLRGNLRIASDAQDVSQEVFLRLLRVPDERVIEHPRAYLFRVAANVVSDWRAGQKTSRRCRSRTLTSLPAADVPMTITTGRSDRSRSARSWQSCPYTSGPRCFSARSTE